MGVCVAGSGLWTLSLPPWGFPILTCGFQGSCAFWGKSMDGSSSWVVWSGPAPFHWPGLSPMTPSNLSKAGPCPWAEWAGRRESSFGQQLPGLCYIIFPQTFPFLKKKKQNFFMFLLHFLQKQYSSFIGTLSPKLTSPETVFGLDLTFVILTWSQWPNSILFSLWEGHKWGRNGLSYAHVQIFFVNIRTLGKITNVCL